MGASLRTTNSRTTQRCPALWPNALMSGCKKVATGEGADRGAIMRACRHERTTPVNRLQRVLPCALERLIVGLIYWVQWDGDPAFLFLG